MATLHLPKRRPLRKDENPRDKLERQLDEGLKETFPTSDPVAITAPGGPAATGEEASQRYKPGQK